MCATTEWTGWSECSTTCGKGYELRTRRFLNRMGRKKCPHVETMDRRNCAGSVPTCPEPEEEKRIMASPDCAVTSWSEWSPCSVSCGNFILYIGCLKLIKKCIFLRQRLESANPLIHGFAATANQCGLQGSTDGKGAMPRIKVRMHF